MGRQPKIDVGRYMQRNRECIEWEILEENKARIAAEMERVQDELDEYCRRQQKEAWEQLKKEREEIGDNYVRVRVYNSKH